MSTAREIPSAFKHGIYSATTVLPGEDPDAFGRLHRGLVAELAPNGALEEDIVLTMARLLWRKQNLATIRIAELAGKRHAQISSKLFHRNWCNEPHIIEFENRINTFLDAITKHALSPEMQKAREAALADLPPRRDPEAVIAQTRMQIEEAAREELGPTYRLVEVGNAATFGGLSEDLDIQERLDNAIEKCLKRLLFLRGLKSISSTSSSSSPQPRLSGPDKAAA